MIWQNPAVKGYTSRRKYEIWKTENVITGINAQAIAMRNCCIAIALGEKIFYAALIDVQDHEYNILIIIQLRCDAVKMTVRLALSF
jgi:hypothetical protein